VFLFGANAQTNGVPSAFTISNIGNCFDGNTSTFGKIVKAALTTTGSANVTLSGMSPTSAPWQSLTLKVKSAIPTNSGTSNQVTVSYSLDGGVSFHQHLFNRRHTCGNRGLCGTAHWSKLRLWCE
jgi:hypothetical protein